MALKAGDKAPNFTLFNTEKKEISLEDELETIVNSLHIIAKTNNNKITIEIDKSIPEFLFLFYKNHVLD